MVKLNVCYIAERDEDLFELSYKSIKDVADKVIVIDGNETPNSYNIGENVMYLHFPYPHEDKGADGNQRSKYLEYLKNNHMGEWCLVLDCDEVVDKPQDIKKTIEFLEEKGHDCASIHMRHFVGNLAKEDAQYPKHYVLCRLFKVTPDLIYPADEHPVLRGWKSLIKVETFCIWHFGYARETFILRRKYLNHCKKSTMHSSEFLTWWYHAHLFGEFPTSDVKFDELPEIIKEEFKVNSDYMYFKNRSIEPKHAECVRQWWTYFNKPLGVVDIGCGRGPYMRYWEMMTQVVGVEVNKYAVENKLCESEIFHSDILNFDKKLGNWSLVTVLDVLEHIEEKDLDKALKIIYDMGFKDFLFSIPFEGDPNLFADKTHKIFKSKEWWIEQLQKVGFVIENAPGHFYFNNQLLIGRKRQ